MEPTYNSFGFNFCWTGAFWNQPPQLGDVVIVKYADRTFYLKRVIGLPGDEISFVNGTLYRNGQPCPEEYVKKPCDWNLEARIVEEDCYYLCGDNRSMPMQNHEFGQVSKRRIIGTPLW